ncbi:hypothetical protein Glove_131g56 [Diversispora epigaea]|uniref:Uncharacterized protein n=1 Tax=Diversispora epigaea TaxID=1348612 RepID=A0A397IXX6_9GLOM|nr:hypothetical protein Glove_131g56 [Diversispora epigaea]
MSAIVTKIVEKYNLTPKMSLSELSQHTTEFLSNFINNIKSGKNKTINIVESSCRITIISPSKSLEEEIIREIAKRILQNKYGFSGNQVNVLFSNQKNKQYESTYCETAFGKTLNIAISNQLPKRLEEETIREMAIRDIKAEAYALAKAANEIQNDQRKKAEVVQIDYPDEFTLESVKERLDAYNVETSPDCLALVDITIMLSNEIQNDQRKKAEVVQIDYPDEFTLESVKERLDAYNVETSPDCLALVDITIMLCLRLAEVTTLHITDAGNTISSGKMENPGKPGVKWFNRYLKSYGLIPRHLRKMGVVYDVVHRAENSGRFITLAGQCLRHNSDKTRLFQIYDED